MLNNLSKKDCLVDQDIKFLRSSAFTSAKLCFFDTMSNTVQIDFQVLFSVVSRKEVTKQES